MTAIDKLEKYNRIDHDIELKKDQVRNDLIHLWGRFELVDVQKIGAHLIFRSRGSQKGFSFRYKPLTIPELIEIVKKLEGELGTLVVQEYANLLSRLEIKVNI